MSEEREENLFRPTSLHSGVWCCLLLPTALYASFNNHNDDVTPVSELKRVTLSLAVALSLVSLNASYGLVYALASEKSGGILRLLSQSVVSDLFERRASAEHRLKREALKRAKCKERRPSAFDFKREANRTLIVDVFIASGLFGYLWIWGPSSLPAWVLISSFAIAFTYGRLLPRLFTKFPASFTFGEGCLVLQAAALYFFEGATSLILETDDTANVEGAYSVIAKAGLLSCSALCLAPLVPGFRWVRKSAFFIPSGFALLMGVTLPFLYHTLKRDPISWVLSVIGDSRVRMGLMAAWLACVAFSVHVVGGQTAAGKRASTRTRKVFHAVATAVYASGVLLDDGLLLFLGSVVALCVFMLLEAIRVHEVAPFAAWLDAYFALFLDEKDQGKLILSNVYLLVGCSLPLWLTHAPMSTTASPLPLLSGVLSIGIGDSFASIVGSKYGRTKFPDSDKTLEGAAASVLGQLAFVWVLGKAGVVSAAAASAVLPAVVVGALAEALTTQVDNLVLPLLVYAMLA